MAWGKIPCPSIDSWLAEFSSMGLQDQGSGFPAGYQQGWFSAPRWSPLFLGS